MLTLTVETRKSPDDVARKLSAFFGPPGLGLEPTREGNRHCFTGGGGHVIANVSKADGKTCVDLETREFEEQVKEFARAVA
jgi:hypothetical protein